MVRVIAAFCMLLVLAACAPRAPFLPTDGDGRYRLDSGDKVRVIVYNEQSLSTEYVVGDNGTISMPMVGEVMARGRTTDELRQAILAELRNGILVNPGASVEIAQFRPFFIVGEVAKPGQYPFVSGLNVLGAIAIAGGFTVRADKNHLVVVRSRDGLAKQWSVEPLTALGPGDVLVVPELFF
jgi:polysaccharide export outer membrane protein